MKSMIRAAIVIAFVSLAVYAPTAKADGGYEDFGGTSDSSAPAPTPTFCVQTFCQNVVYMKTWDGGMGSPYCAFVTQNAYCGCAPKPDGLTFDLKGKCIAW